ncbi:hypothetical protein PRZ48_001838 [Zasmidium cellare]|uniref:C2H2-type domain-containing protein n=1 Tax=Zasmidium cellare TaxID=395010 RepID=A0ABR0F318_ZASCE|nr:hypothetical protein PRZ48_001838 [Zasmidium cellare]
MTTFARDEHFDEDTPIFKHHESFEAKDVKLEPPPEEYPDFPTTKFRRENCPSLDALIQIAPGFNPSSRSSSESEAKSSPKPSYRRGDMPEAGASAPAEGGPHDGSAKASGPDVLRVTAEMAIRVGAKTPPLDSKDLAERPVHRVDSAQDSSESVPQLPPEKRPQRSERASPHLKLETAPTTANGAAALDEDSMTKSPTLAKHMIQIEEKASSNYPPAQATSPTTETPGTSSRKASLPPFRQLADLAEIASQHAQQTQQETRPPAQHSHQHSQSFSSTTSQSPMAPYHPSYTNSAQTSPVSYHGFARSPTSTEGFTYGSPSQNPGSAYYYPDRRTSVANDSAHTYPTPVPSLPSNPSSGETPVGNAGSSTDGYSTSHTTPIDPGTVQPEAMGRPILPPPPGMAIIPAGGFMCDYPGCTALPFQTQYLLSSHRNVHSQIRSHYCPVEGCPRGEGGRGFKRKNEMIRHGLVHNSPGYICPFCPDREHRYPRPDNLQRHVRVHHVDKDRDDPALREVLAQRIEGNTQKQRRRRTQGSTTVTGGGGQAPESAP